MRRLCIAMAIVAMGLPEVICRQFTKEEGPFEAHVYNVSSCIVEKPWFHVNVTTYTSNGRSLLRGKIVTQRSIKNVKFSIQLYFIEQGKTKAFELKNQNCHNVLVRVILQSLGMRYNAQRCTMEPTIAEFSNLDLNAIIHTVVKNLYYGTAMIRWAIAIPTTRLMCLDINLQFLKLNGNKLQ